MKSVPRYQWTRAVFGHPTLSSTARLVAAAMAEYASREAWAPVWPSRARLAQDTHLTPKTVTKATQELTDAGLLERVSDSALMHPDAPDHVRAAVGRMQGKDRRQHVYVLTVPG